MTVYVLTLSDWHVNGAEVLQVGAFVNESDAQRAAEDIAIDGLLQEGVEPDDVEPDPLDDDWTIVDGYNTQWPGGPTILVSRVEVVGR